MIRFKLILVLSLAAGIFASPSFAAPTSVQQAALDGHYAGIHQKRLEELQRSLNSGAASRASAASQIEQETAYVNRLRNRWAHTRYATVFNANYLDEITTQAARPVHRPLRIPFLFKGLILIAVFFICRWMWKARGAKGKPVPVDYNAFPAEMTAEESQRVSEAQAALARQVQEMLKTKNALQSKINGLAAQAAELAARAEALAEHTRQEAVAELTTTAPDFQELLGRYEFHYPGTLADWSNPVWKDFIDKPKTHLLLNARYAYIEEINLLPGETALAAPRTAPVIAGKGPIIVRSNAATRAAGRTAIHNILLRAAVTMPSEIRFSLLDPLGLGAGFPMRAELPRVRPSARTIADELAEIIDDIRRVNDIVGQAPRFADLSAEQRAGEAFEIVAALDYPRAYQNDPRAMEYLARIAQSGPHAGRHLILEWDSPSDADLARFENHELIDVLDPGNHIEPLASPELQHALLAAASAAKSRSTGGDWNSQIRPEKFWTESSARMVSTPVGERLRIWFGDNQEGKPCAHGMLAGQTGSGKSFLLHVLITGLAARYSPAELRFVLVDGKQGVEFEAYRSLPHAQVVCLRTSPAIARSVLEDFMAEMDDRYVKFQQQGVTKLEDYRRKSGAAMPRMLMVVDEYQQLLEGDPDRGAQMLSRVLEKGRAAGIHLVLGSQTFEVRGLPAAAMTHVHLRAALSLPIDYIQSVSAFGPEGKKLIRDLAPSGQVVINDESGRDGANSRGAVARLDVAAGSGLAQVVADITAAAADGSSAVVLSGNDDAVLADNPFVRQWRNRAPDALALQETARRPLRAGGFGIAAWSAADHPLPLWLGRKFDVHGHLVAVLRRAPGHNLLALGSDAGVRLSMLANGLASLRAMRPMEDCDVLLLDGLSAGQPGAGMLSAGLELLHDAGARVRVAGPDEAAEALDAFAAIQPQNPDSARLLVLSEPEYFPALATPPGFGATPTGAARGFKDLLRGGPPRGTHSIMTASGIGALSSVLHPSRDAALFNHRVVQQSNEEESMTLFSSLAATRIMAQTDHHKAGMYVDTVQGVRAAQLFKAYAASPDIYGDQSPAALASALHALFAEAAQ